MTKTKPKTSMATPRHDSSGLPTDHHHRIPAELLQLVPPDTGTLVELGAGVVGTLFKRINPAVLHAAIAVDRQAPRLGTGRPKKILPEQIDKLGPAMLGLRKGKVDCLVYHHVLEHLPNPLKQLRQHRQWLTDTGMVLACVRNIQHWSVILGLMQGGSPWDQGSGESNPLGFFTVAGIQALFAEAGFHVLEIRGLPAHGTLLDAEGRVWPPARLPATSEQDQGDFQRALKPALAALDIPADTFARQSSAFQLLVRAIKQPPRVPRLLVQSMVLKPVGAVNDKRIHEPNRFLATLPGVRVITQELGADLKAGQPGEQKIFVWQRPILQAPAALASIQKLRRAGYLIVVEFDDDPRHWPAIPANDYLSFRGVHCIQTSTPELAEFLRQFNPNIAIFPNQMAELPPPRQYRADAPVTLFFGALNREDDWAPILPALNRVLAEQGQSVAIRVVHDKTLFDSLTTPHKSFQPTCPYPRYLELLRGCDIGLLPLEPTPFNVLKSDLKLLEHAAHGVVALASPTVYAKSLRDGENGVLFQDPEEFERQLRMLLTDGARRRRIAQTAYRWVARQRLLSQHYRKRHDWYLRMLAERERLDKELLRRVPALSAAGAEA